MAVVLADGGSVRCPLAQKPLQIGDGSRDAGRGLD
jgi:hypothetical protein